jgi:hypothetical protein
MTNKPRSSMATKKPDETRTTKPPPAAPQPRPAQGPVKTQMLGEHGDDDLGYDPAIIKTEPIPDDD